MESQIKLDAASQPIIQLRSQVQGTVITPADSAYEQARLAWNRVVDQHPAVIVIPARPEDVVEAVRMARAEGLGIAVQTSGHGVILPADGCMLILTEELSGLEVNPEDQTAWVGGGVKWQPVLAVAQEHGLAPLLGSTPDVGAVGYTLGGGMGWLARKYGLCADSTRAFQMVTAEGQIVHASPEENPDLFWALRGGGKGMGVVTAMQIQLYPVKTVYAGNLYYPAEMAKDVFARFRAWTANAPDELTSSVVLMNYPPVPVLPELLRGKSFVMLRGCYCGSPEEGEALLRFWRDWHAPLIDDFKTMPFTEIAHVSNDPVDPMPASTTSAWLTNINEPAVETLVQYAFKNSRPSTLVFFEVRQAGGAVARQISQSGAFGSRQMPYSLECVGLTPSSAAKTSFDQAMHHMRADLKDAVSNSVYLNFMEGSESWERTRDGFLPDTYRRLQTVKARFDPDNLFRFGHHISPEMERKNEQ
jgi:FAD/FMN-containing dehydrogenase